MTKDDLDIIQKSLLIRKLGGSFDVYTQATLKPNTTILQRLRSLIFKCYVPIEKALVIIWHIDGLDFMLVYPESLYHFDSYSLEEDRIFLQEIVKELKKIKRKMNLRERRNDTDGPDRK